jgi:hypothetical protein
MTTPPGGGPQGIAWAQPARAPETFGLEWLHARRLPWSAALHLNNNTKRHKGNPVQLHTCFNGESLHPVAGDALVRLIAGSPDSAPWDAELVTGPVGDGAAEAAATASAASPGGGGPERAEPEAASGDNGDGGAPGPGGELGGAEPRSLAQHLQRLLDDERLALPAVRKAHGVLPPSRYFMLKAYNAGDVQLSRLAGAWMLPHVNAAGLNAAFCAGGEVFLVINAKRTGERRRPGLRGLVSACL